MDSINECSCSSIISFVCAAYVFYLIGQGIYMTETTISKPRNIAQILLSWVLVYALQKKILVGFNITFTVVSILNAFFVYWFHVRAKKFQPRSMKDYVVIVTGANSGIGLETARELYKMGATVILACRTEKKAKAAIADIVSSSSTPGLVEPKLMLLDLSKLDSVREFVSAFNALGLSLDILINNAGLMLEKRSITSDGFETQFCTNHLGPFLLTNLLLPKLKESKFGRIINVSSCGHKLIKRFNFDDVMAVKKYHFFQVYIQTKLANMMFTHELSKRLKGSHVTVNAVHPGLVLTEFTQHMHPVLKFIYSILKHFFVLSMKTSSQGAYTSIYAAISPDMKGVTGKYLVNSEIHAPNPYGVDDHDCKRLWDLSSKLVNL